MVGPIRTLTTTRKAPQYARSYIEARNEACSLWQDADAKTRAGAIKSLQQKTNATHYNALVEALHGAKPEDQATMDSGQHLQVRQEALSMVIKLLLFAGVTLIVAGLAGAGSHLLDPTKLGGVVASIQSTPVWFLAGMAGVGGVALVGAALVAKKRSSEQQLLAELAGHPYPNKTFNEASVHLWLTGEALPVTPEPTTVSPNGRPSWLPAESQRINILL